jgi:hypothetical protein
MEFVINEPEKISVKIGANVYMMSQPTLGLQKKLQEDLKESELNGSSPYDPMINWAVSLGLPKEVCEQLPQSSFQSLFEFVSDTSKKKR